MGRTCSICNHEQRQAIEAALISGTPYRNISKQFSVSLAALNRHKSEHLPAHLASARQAEEVAQADDLLAELRGLQAKAYELLLKAEKQNDLRTALLGVREARGCLELLAELEGELDRRQTVNVTLGPEWQQVRMVIIEALQSYPDARVAVAKRLHELEAGGNDTGE
jgi:hypothetical protein